MPTPTNRLPSYTAMCELAAQDQQVSGLLLQERWQEATAGFTVAATDGVASAEDTSWLNLLKVHSKTGVRTNAG